MIWVRSALFNVWFYSVTVVLAIISIPTPLLPADSTRRVARLWARLVVGALGPLCNIRVVVTGREHLPPAGPALIASQHQSAFDTVVWLLLVPEVAYVLKKELLSIPLYGMMCRKLGMITVDRSAGPAAVRSLLRGGDAAMADSQQIVIFPEGTRAPPGKPLPLLPGIAALASRTALPVIPVVTDSGTCWGRRAFRKTPGVIHVAIQPPLPPRMERPALMAQLARLYADAPAIIARDVDNSVGAVSQRFSGRPSKAT